MPNLDPFKFVRWMNARKLTPGRLAELAGVDQAFLESTLHASGPVEIDDERLGRLATGLAVETGRLIAAAGAGRAVLVRSAEEMYRTRRPIQRDGIHFYDYYSMAGPEGRVAPVILDILCPADRLPALNNGHLEPAITVNLGPGDIHGRWGEELSDDTWRVLAANTGADPWITGDSYVEPSYCPHSYALAGDVPARIVSYTADSNLAALIEENNTWSEPAFERWSQFIEKGGLAPEELLRLALARRGYTDETAAARLGVDPGSLPASLDTLRALGAELGIDYRLLLPAVRRHDAVGKTCRTVEESRESIRPFGPYEVASMAGAPHLPDLSGLFVRVVVDEGDVPMRHDDNETHYLVTDGDLHLDWVDERGELATATLSADGSAWVAPFVAHRWRGTGAVLKFNSGGHVGYLDLFELTNTYEPAATLRRGHRDLSGWGYQR